MPTIHAGRVVLRDKRPEDAESDYRWRCDEELSQLDATTSLRISFREFVRFYQDELRYPTPWSRRFAIDDLIGRHIGNCMYYDIDVANHEAEVGIMIGERAYWGKGYGFDAMVGLVDHIFSLGAMRRLYLHTLTWNHRARASFKRVGFTELGEVRRGGYLFQLMDLRREQWEAIREQQLALLREHAEQGKREVGTAGGEPTSGPAQKRAPE